MKNLRSERGLILGLTLTLLGILFIFGTIVALLGHQGVIAVVLFVLGVLIYPIGTKVARRVASR